MEIVESSRGVDGRFLKGKPSVFRGRHHTQEAKYKSGKAHRGKSLSKEHKRKLGELSRAHWQNPDLRAAQVEARKRSWQNDAKRRANSSAASKRRWQDPAYRARIVGALRSREFTDEHRAKLSKAGQGKHLSLTARQKMIDAKTGVPLSPEHARKIGAASRRRWQNPVYAAKMSSLLRQRWQDPEFKDRQIRAMLRGARIRPTTPERQMLELLNVHFPGEWRYTGNGEVVIGGCNPDFINVNGQKTVIEVFGDYWHSQHVTGKTPEREVADRIVRFAKYGFRCVVVWEHEVQDEKLVLDRVLNQRGEAAQGRL